MEGRGKQASTLGRQMLLPLRDGGHMCGVNYSHRVRAVVGGGFLGGLPPCLVVPVV